MAHRQAHFEAAGGFVTTPVFERSGLARGQNIDGPAIIEQADTTIVVHPRQRARVRADRSILIEVAHAR